MISSTERWRSELTAWLVVSVAIAAAFWMGTSPGIGLVVGAWMLLVVLLVHLGRRHTDALRIVGGVGDERDRALYTQATAVAGTALWLVITPWWLYTVATGDHDLVLLTLELVFATSFVGSALYYSRRS